MLAAILAVSLGAALGALLRWGLGLCAAVLVLAALYVSLGRELVPLVAEYRLELEDRVTAMVVDWLKTLS